MTEMKRIRLLMIINNLKSGGAQRYFIDVLNTLDKDLFDIRVVSLGMGNFFQNETTYPIIELGIEKDAPRPFRLIRLVKIIHDFNPHILHTQLRYADTVGQMLGRLLDVPATVTTIHSTVEWRREKRTIITAVEDMALKKTDRIIAVSRSLKEYIAEERGADRNKIIVLPCGIDLSVFRNSREKRTAMRQQLGFSDQTVVFACTAQFRPEKRHDLLLQRFAELRKRTSTPLKLLLIGATGVLSDEMEGLIQSFGLQDDVILCGGDRMLVAKYLSASDIYVMHSESEGTSLAVAEGMASGLPVLLPDLPHFTQQGNNGVHGFFFDFHDAEGFIKDALKLAEDRSLREKIGATAQKHAIEAYGIEAHIKPLTAIYNELFARHVLKKHLFATVV